LGIRETEKKEDVKRPGAPWTVAQGGADEETLRGEPKEERKRRVAAGTSCGRWCRRWRRRGDPEGRDEGREQETSSGWDELWEVV
jgi:hypothetical protein